MFNNLITGFIVILHSNLTRQFSFFKFCYPFTLKVFICEDELFETLYTCHTLKWCCFKTKKINVQEKLEGPKIIYPNSL